MATKKQQRRKYLRAREHARRPPVEEGGEAKPERAPKAARTRGGRKVPQPPSWTRSARRAALFAAGVFLFVQIVPIGGKLTPAQAAIQAAIFFVWLIPFGYVMDGFLFRRWLKNNQR